MPQRRAIVRNTAASVPALTFAAGNGGDSFPDVLPHCADYMSAEHIARLLESALISAQPPIRNPGRSSDVPNTQQNALMFALKEGAPSGEIDVLVARAIDGFKTFAPRVWVDAVVRGPGDAPNTHTYAIVFSIVAP